MSADNYFDWNFLIGEVLKNFSANQAIQVAVWISILLALLFFFLQIWISISNIKRANQGANLSLIEKIFKNGGVIPKKLMKGRERWMREHMMVRDESDSNYTFALSNGRIQIRDMRGILPLFKPSPLRFAPALLTSLGVLGTFFGISLGLANFDPENVGADTQALVTSSTQMLMGMKTAFYTSLVGMGSSIIFTLVSLALIFNIEQRYLANIINKVRNLCVEVLPIDYLVALDPEKQNQVQEAQLEAARNMQDAVSILSDASQRMADAAGGFSSKAIVDGVASAFHSAVDQELKPIFKEISNELSLLREIKSDNGEKLINVLIKSIREDIVTPLGREIEQTSLTVTRSTEAVEALSVKLETVMAGFSDAIQTISSFQKVTTSKLTQFADSLKDVLGEFRTETTSVLNRVSTEITSALQGSIDGMKAQREAFIESSFQAAGMFKEQGGALTAIGQQAAEVMDRAGAELERGLGNIDTKVLAMSGTIQKELESFRIEYQDKLSTFFTEQNGLIEKALERQKGTLEGVIDDYRKTFEEDHERRRQMFQLLTDSHASLQESSQTIQALMENVGALDSAVMDNLLQVASEVGKQAGVLGKRYSEASNAFTHMTSELPKAMDEYFTRANVSYEGFFRDFDKQAGRIHLCLAESANHLVAGAIEQKRLKAEEISQ